MKRPLVRLRAQTYRRLRLLFPSPAEIALIRLMGGIVIVVPWFRNPFRWNRRAAFPLAFVLWRGRLFKSENVEREVRIGKCYVDFGNDICRAVEVLSAEWHRDVVYEYDRQKYLEARGWRLLYIWANEIRDRPADVRRRVRDFLLE